MLRTEVRAPAEIEQELIDDELRSISGGAYQTTSWPGTETTQNVQAQVMTVAEIGRPGPSVGGTPGDSGTFRCDRRGGATPGVAT